MARTRSQLPQKPDCPPSDDVPAPQPEPPRRVMLKKKPSESAGAKAKANPLKKSVPTKNRSRSPSPPDDIDPKPSTSEQLEIEIESEPEPKQVIAPSLKTAGASKKAAPTKSRSRSPPPLNEPQPKPTTSNEPQVDPEVELEAETQQAIAPPTKTRPKARAAKKVAPTKTRSRLPSPPANAETQVVEGDVGEEPDVDKKNPPADNPTPSSSAAQELVLEQEAPPVDQQVLDFSKFKLAKVIDESTLSKSITLLGTYNGQNAVIKVEKTNIAQDDITEALQDKITSDRDFINHIYSSYTLSSIDSQNAINNLRATVIWPANQAVLDKYTHAEHILLSETPDTYLRFVEPYIENRLEDKDHNQWVYNILEGKSEADRIIFNDTDADSGFMLVADLKWSGDIKDLKLLAICHRRDIRSLRDLNDKHLILLKNILTQGTKAVRDKFKKLRGQLRTYIHYQPSFYHFHVHFEVVDASDYRATDRDNLLNTVINNISLFGDYYKKSTLTYPLSRANDLYQVLKQAKRI